MSAPRPIGNKAARDVGIWPKCGHPHTPENTSGIAKTRPTGQCRICKRGAMDRYNANPDRAANRSATQRRYWEKTKRAFRTGWTHDAYETAYRLQGGKCAICLGWCEALVGDHCHKTSRPRALLCRHCNWLLGHAHEDAARLRSAADYIERFQQAV